MHISAFTPIDEFDDTVWRAFIARAGKYPVEAHPDVVRWAVPHSETIWIYTDTDQGEIQTMALLAPKRLPTIRELPWLSHIDGWRLVGHELIGRNDDVAHQRFAAACIDILSRGHTDCVYLEDIEVDSPLWRESQLAGSDHDKISIAYPKPAQPHWQIRFPARASDYWQTVPRKVRYNSRRSAKRLSHRIEVIETAEQVPDFLAAARAISEESWQGKRVGIRFANSERERGMLTALANIGALRSYLLYHQEHPIAFVYGWQWQGFYSYDEIGYDGRFAAQGPGKVLLFRLLEDLIERNTPAILDFGNGDADYKRRFGTHEIVTGPMTMNSQKIKTRVALTLRELRNMADRSVRQTLRRTGLYERVRRAYHHV